MTWPEAFAVVGVAACIAAVWIVVLLKVGQLLPEEPPAYRGYEMRWPCWSQDRRKK